MKPAGDYCGHFDENIHYTQQRMLAMFGECSQMNRFDFQLDKGSVENWLRLYAGAIRCSLEPCKRGFVFLTWRYDGHPEDWAHASTLYFDIPSKLQVFIDPSDALAVTEVGNILDVLENNHVWMPASENPILRVTRPYEASGTVRHGQG